MKLVEQILVTYDRRTGNQLQMNRLSLRNDWSQFKFVGKLPIILEEFIEYTPIKSKGCLHVTSWTCKH